MRTLVINDAICGGCATPISVGCECDPKAAQAVNFENDDVLDGRFYTWHDDE